MNFCRLKVRIFFTLKVHKFFYLWCVQPAIWLALGVIAVIKLKFDYLLIVAIALCLGTANIIGFTKCRKGMTGGVASLSEAVPSPCNLLVSSCFVEESSCLW